MRAMRWWSYQWASGLSYVQPAALSISIPLGIWSAYRRGTTFDHATLLLPMIEAVLAEAGFALRALDGIAYGRGPGSFTGVRTGLLIAKTLAQAGKLPVFPVDTLEALAANAVEGDSVVAGLDARKGEIIWARFRVRQGLPILLDPARLTTPEEFLDSIPAGSLVLGSACQAALPRRAEVRVLPADLWRVRAVSVGRVAWPLMQESSGQQWPQLRPDYVRPADVQVHRG